MKYAWTDGEIWIDNILYNENKLLVTDPNFFTFFTFPLKVGDAATVFEPPGIIWRRIPSKTLPPKTRIPAQTALTD